MLRFLHGRQISVTEDLRREPSAAGATCVGIWSAPPRCANFLNAKSLRLLSQSLGRPVKGYFGHALGACAGEGGGQEGRNGWLSGTGTPK